MPEDVARGPATNEGHEKASEGRSGPDGGVPGTTAAPDGKPPTSSVVPPEVDEFGLPTKPPRRRSWSDDEASDHSFVDAETGEVAPAEADTRSADEPVRELKERCSPSRDQHEPVGPADVAAKSPSNVGQVPTCHPVQAREGKHNRCGSTSSAKDAKYGEVQSNETQSRRRSTRTSNAGVSEWSHQQLAPPLESKSDGEKEEETWQEMPALATHRIYDDWGKVLAKEYSEVDDDHLAYGTLGGAGKGYTRVQVDDDVKSATSMDDNTAYLFNDRYQTNALTEEDEEARDLCAQMQTTKQLLTEGQRIAYVGLVRLSIGKILSELDRLEKTKGSKKQVELAMETTKMWAQKIMLKLYEHMDIDSQEQIMVEQLAQHGVLPADVTPVLMQNARVRNPTKIESDSSANNSARPSSSRPRTLSQTELQADPPQDAFSSNPSDAAKSSSPERQLSPGLPAFEGHTADELVPQSPSQLRDQKDLELDLRWTVLCDLFLLLIADSNYDARSRTLLEYVGAELSVDWQEICRFEKRVTDALEMQEQADKENWNEEEHLNARAKSSKKTRLMVMGLCTVGGGLVIGLSAGLLAPVIGAGLAAGFTTIGVAGTSTFLGGTGAAAIIGTAGTVTGSVIGVRASNRRTGAVKTFEYRPLFNNKRPNLIVTVSGWTTGNVDDVRLPFSTVDPIMGDVYSVNWEPEMLRSMGQTIRILATEALTQTIQQVLGGTILTVLMAGLSLPIVLTKLSYLVDNPWTVSLARADSTGLILADSIVDRNLGLRPITLVGFSLGSRVIFSCLKELAKRGAMGLVQNVYLFGSPIVAKNDEYLRARSVVAGRFVNGYAANDWILGYLFRATSGGIMRVSGLASVDVAGIENKDFTTLVAGHMAYRGMMPTLLQECGWAVEGLEFNEIEDPDPENHEKRQRELINEIEAARNELEAKEKAAAADGTTEKKSGFKAFFTRKKTQKKEWEMYDERSQRVLEGEDGSAAEKMAQENSNVMFDVDAIRHEALKLAIEDSSTDEISKHLQIREITCTMPALKVSTADVDTPARSPGHDSPAPASYDVARDSVPRSPGRPGGDPEGREKADGPYRPPASNNTTPNPWAREDDFGKEERVEISFE